MGVPIHPAVPIHPRLTVASIKMRLHKIGKLKVAFILICTWKKWTFGEMTVKQEYCETN